MISIALCTYNGEKFLREQLDSIALQTLLADELVVCDDCSTDNTLTILERFRERVSFPVHIHQNTRNLGTTRNFEKAIGLCSGDIIALCDQDDVWKPHKLERLAAVFKANPDAGYVFSNAELVDEHLRPLGQFLWGSIGFHGEIYNLFVQGEQFMCLTKKHFVTGATMAFRDFVGKRSRPYPDAGYWLHDGWIALVSSATGALGVPVNEPLTYYRQHPKQQIGTRSKHQSLLDMYRGLKANQHTLFVAWEKNCLQILELKSRSFPQNSTVLEQNLSYLREFETHFLNRRKILTSKNFSGLKLICKEILSGRYGRFSGTWRSVFRDIFL